MFYYMNTILCTITFRLILIAAIKTSNNDITDLWDSMSFAQLRHYFTWPVALVLALVPLKTFRVDLGFFKCPHYAK